MATSKKQVAKSSPEFDSSRELLILGHLIKYNLYLLSKATVFASIVAKSKSIESAIKDTEVVMQELDLDAKTKKERQQEAAN